mmetsp:Transcript_105274/g.293067  ORF Transcript_105274/g.293067 Transcript_105274/m.293067 type:complete len:201 (+) Transcript_105274:633-1235(+)
MGTASGSCVMLSLSSFTQTFFEDSSINARSLVLLTTVSGWQAGSHNSARLRTRSFGFVNLSQGSCSTWNSMICPVVPGSEGSVGKPPKGSSGPVFTIRTTVPGSKPLKSTMTSARSAGPKSKASSGSFAGVSWSGSVPSPGKTVLWPSVILTTFGNKDWSPPIMYNGTCVPHSECPLPPGIVTKNKFKKRELHPFSRRKR